MAWEQGNTDPALQQELRVRADTFKSVVDATYEALCNALGETVED